MLSSVRYIINLSSYSMLQRCTLVHISFTCYGNNVMIPLKLLPHAPILVFIPFVVWSHCLAHTTKQLLNSIRSSSPSFVSLYFSSLLTLLGTPYPRCSLFSHPCFSLMCSYYVYFEPPLSIKRLLHL